MPDGTACNEPRTAGEVAQYLNSTCYYVGPVLAPCTDASAALKRVFAADVTVANSNDPYGSGAVLSAAQVLRTSLDVSSPLQPVLESTICSLP